MNVFHWPRFVRALRNDVVGNARGIVIATLAFLCIGTMLYIGQASHPADITIIPADFLFSVVLMCSGLLLTSVSWNDMHHPLGRFQVLMLPIAPLERFVARYLLTGPLFCLYAIVVYIVFERLANWLCQAIYGVQLPLLNLGSGAPKDTLRFYFTLQPLAFAGAIYFRNYAAIRTTLAVTGLYLLFTLVVAVAIRLIYWDHFDTPFEASVPIRFGLFVLLGPAVSTAIVLLADFWVLYLAWLFLTDHEVQDGI